MNKKEELVALGIPEERAEDLFDLYLSDIRKLEDHYMETAKETERLRTAISATVNLIKKTDTLKRIVQYVNSAHYRDERAAAEEGDSKCQ